MKKFISLLLISLVSVMLIFTACGKSNSGSANEQSTDLEKGETVVDNETSDKDSASEDKKSDDEEKSNEDKDDAGEETSEDKTTKAEDDTDDEKTSKKDDADEEDTDETDTTSEKDKEEAHYSDEYPKEGGWYISDGLAIKINQFLLDGESEEITIVGEVHFADEDEGKTITPADVVKVNVYQDNTRLDYENGTGLDEELGDGTYMTFEETYKAINVSENIEVEVSFKGGDRHSWDEWE